MGFFIDFGRNIIQMVRFSRQGLILFNISIEPHLTKVCESVEVENWRWQVVLKRDVGAKGAGFELRR